METSAQQANPLSPRNTSPIVWRSETFKVLLFSNTLRGLKGLHSDQTGPLLLRSKALNSSSSSRLHPGSSVHSRTSAPLHSGPQASWCPSTARLGHGGLCRNHQTNYEIESFKLMDHGANLESTSKQRSAGAKACLRRPNKQLKHVDQLRSSLVPLAAAIVAMMLAQFLMVSTELKPEH